MTMAMTSASALQGQVDEVEVASSRGGIAATSMDGRLLGPARRRVARTWRTPPFCWAGCRAPGGSFWVVEACDVHVRVRSAELCVQVPDLQPRCRVNEATIVGEEAIRGGRR